MSYQHYQLSAIISYILEWLCQHLCIAIKWHCIYSHWIRNMHHHNDCTTLFKDMNQLFQPVKHWHFSKWKICNTVWMLYDGVSRLWSTANMPDKFVTISNYNGTFSDRTFGRCVLKLEPYLFKILCYVVYASISMHTHTHTLSQMLYWVTVTINFLTTGICIEIRLNMYI